MSPILAGLVMVLFAAILGIAFAVGVAVGVVGSVLVVNRIVVWLERKGLMP